MVSGLSLDLSYGDFLDKHGIEKGIFRKGEQRAGGFVTVTIPGAPAQDDTPYDLLGAIYITNENLRFYRANTGVAQSIPSYIAITRGTRSFDGLPTPWVYTSGIVYQSSNQYGTGTHYSGVFNVETQLMDWAGAASAPSTGAIYYIGISGYTVQLVDDVAAADIGTGFNVGTNAIVRYTATSLPANATVNNSTDLTGGASFESDDDYKERIGMATNRTFTTNSIRSAIQGINGVRSAYIYQDVGTDKLSMNGTWTTDATGYTGGIHITGWYTGGVSTGNYVSGNLYGQKFSPGTAIMGLKKVTFRGRRVGLPSSLVVGLRNVLAGDTYLTSGIFDTYDVSPPASNWQDFDINIEYLNMEPTESYRLDFWCSEKSGASGASWWDSNYWEIATGSAGQSGNLGVGDAYTGLLRLGETATVDDHASEDTNVSMRTRYGASAFNVDIAVKDGYNYEEISQEVDNKLDWVSGEGYAPIGINYTIQQATPVYILYSSTTYLTDDATADVISVKARIDSEVEKYVEALQPGENVVYSQVFKNIINDNKIWRLDDLELWEVGGTHSTGEDISIGDGEIAVFSGSTVNQG